MKAVAAISCLVALLADITTHKQAPSESRRPPARVQRRRLHHQGRQLQDRPCLDQPWEVLQHVPRCVPSGTLHSRSLVLRSRLLKSVDSAMFVEIAFVCNFALKRGFEIKVIWTHMF